VAEGVYKAVDCGESTATFDDDGTTAYGYLLRNGEVIADVWLYNNLEAPSEIKQLSKDGPPLNAERFVANEKYERIESEDDVKFEFYSNQESGTIVVEIILRGQVFAVLESSSKVGWSRLAKIEGPLAKPLLKKYAQ
jgi:hypothetical protein